jgi:peptidoglycan/LPS O-acetylase OafA/YrhL
VHEKKGALPGLTGARFIAATLVVVEHLTPYVSYPQWFRPFTLLAGPAVSFFFILSGFVLSYNYAGWFRAGLPRERVREFIVARIARVYPMYLVTLVAITPLILYFLHRDGALLEHAGRSIPGAGKMCLAWVLNACLLQVYVPNHDMLSMWNGPSWSVACEAFFYLSFPLLTLWIHRFARRAPGRGASVGILLLTILLGVVQLLLVWVVPLVVTSVIPGERGEAIGTSVVYYTPMIRFFEFAIGCCLAHAAIEQHAFDDVLGRQWVRNAILASLIAATLTLAVCAAPSDLGRFYFYSVYVPVSAGFVVVFAAGRTFLTPVLDSKLFVVLGDASYSLYLLHWVGIVAVRNNHMEQFSGTAIAALVAALLLLPPVTLFYVEHPARRWIRHWCSREDQTKVVGLAIG